MSKAARQEKRALRQTKRLDAKQKRVETRQAGATDRAEARSAARTVAYENGINPVGDSISGLSSIVGSVVGSGLLGNAASGAFKYPSSVPTADLPDDNPSSYPARNYPSGGKSVYGADLEPEGDKTMLYVVVAGIAALFLMKK